MAFIFPFATLLRLREIAAEREERLVAQILGQINLTNQALLEVDQKIQQEQTQRDAALVRTSSAAELMLSYDRERLLQDMKASAEEQLAKLDKLRSEQMTSYEAAYRKKELLASLKQDQRKIFLEARARNEQSTMDDNFSSRRPRN